MVYSFSLIYLLCDAVMGSKLMIGDFFFLNPSRGREDGSAHVVLELLSS